MVTESACPPTKAPRIALLLPRFSRYGGVEQFGYRLAEALAQKGYDVDFLCARQEEAAPPGVRVIPVGRVGGLKVLKMLWFMVQAEHLRKKGDYDLTVSLGKTWNQDLNRVGGGPLRAFWEKSGQSYPSGLPRLGKCLARRLSPSNWLTLLIEKRQFSQGAEVVAVSHLVRDWLLEEHPDLSPAKVSVIYNKPDLSRFSPPTSEERLSCRKALASGNGIALEENGAQRESEVFMGTASTNFRLKGVGPLIHALSLYPRPVRLFIAGGRGSTEYRELARALGVEERVHFCGRVEDMPSFLRALDLFVLPTFYDACSNAVLEALACGCRVISSASNGSSRFLPEEAVLTDPGDANAIAWAMERLMQNPPPEAFAWPDDTAAGLDDFVAKIESMLISK